MTTNSVQVNDWQAKHKRFLEEHYGQLVGAKIVGFTVTNLYGELWPTLILQKGSIEFQVTIQQDKEGNGPGYAFISADEI